MNMEVKSFQSARKGSRVELNANIAIVMDTIAEEAISVDINGNTVDVVAHLQNVPPLAPKDRVLIVATSEGYVVTGLLRKVDEPAYQGVLQKDGAISINAKNGITIETGDARIELTAKGKINVDGKNIYTISEGLHRIQGAKIELN